MPSPHRLPQYPPEGGTTNASLAGDDAGARLPRQNSRPPIYADRPVEAVIRTANVNLGTARHVSRTLFRSARTDKGATVRLAAITARLKPIRARTVAKRLRLAAVGKHRTLLSAPLL